LKPSNVIVNPDGEPVLIDFGLARAVGSGQRLTKTGARLGTPEYMSPEQAKGDGGDLGPATDVWSLGVIFYELLAGRLPFDARDWRALFAQIFFTEPPPPSAVRKGLDPSVDALCLRALAKEVEDRYASMAEFAEALRRFLRARPGVPAIPYSPPGQIRTRCPECGQHLKGPPEFLGKRVGCPVCQARFIASGHSETVVVMPPSRPSAEPTPHVSPGAGKQAQNLRSELTNSLGMRFVLIPAGKFQMGSPKGETGRSRDEFEHAVEITRQFYIGVYQVTQVEYERVMGTNPSYFRPTAGGRRRLGNIRDTERFPVECVSWHDAKEFCSRLSDLPAERQHRRQYCLPTEAEWEYACRAGARGSMPFHFGLDLSSSRANFIGSNPYGGAPKGPYPRRTAAVGAYPANGWGLYDMHGNVWEWCHDWYEADYYRMRPGKDPQGPEKSRQGLKALRGGAWNYNGKYCRSACRKGCPPDLRNNAFGFRVVISLRQGE
jgi:formylglycine-generating enzyme required for sulfatase activity